MVGYERGRVAWPGLELELAVFASHVARIGGTDAHAEDLYLACACAHGVVGAAALFDQRYITEVPRFIARIDRSPEVAGEIQQVVRALLLVSEVGARPRIAEYTGRGPLGAWVRVIATRELLKRRRNVNGRVASDADAAARLVAADPSPEVALIRQRYGVELAGALKAAIAALPERDRGLLKLSIIDELTIDELCGLYDVHRATVARWIVRLKEQIFDGAIAALRSRFALESHEVESLCRAVRSQLDFSLGGWLDEP